MARLKAVVKSLDEVDERFHDLYIERNGEFQLDRIEGMATEADLQRVKTALDSEREEHRELKERFRPFRNMDLEKVQEKLDKFDELKLVAESKGGDVEERANEIAEARIKSRVGPIERERDTLKEQLQERDKVIENFQEGDRKRQITDKVRQAGLSNKIRTEALDDALMIAERVFDVDSDGNVVTKDDSGVTPGIDPETWFTEMQPKRPHWWPESEGGGARGNTGGNSPSNPWSAKNWNMTEQGRVYKENPQRAEQMAKSAGTSVGGPKPE